MMQEKLSEKLSEQGWAVCDKTDLQAYLSELAKEYAGRLAEWVAEDNASEEDMGAEYSALIELKGYYKRSNERSGGEMWRVELNDMTDSGIIIIPLENRYKNN